MRVKKINAFACVGNGELKTNSILTDALFIKLLILKIAEIKDERCVLLRVLRTVSCCVMDERNVNVFERERNLGIKGRITNPVGCCPRDGAAQPEWHCHDSPASEAAVRHRWPLQKSPWSPSLLSESISQASHRQSLSHKERASKEEKRKRQQNSKRIIEKNDCELWGMLWDS